MDDFESVKTQWSSWADTEFSKYDSFNTVTAQSQGTNGSTGRLFTYVRPEGSYGGQARGVFPNDWDLKNANYMVFDIKGDGSTQDLLFRLDSRKFGNQRSNFSQREFDRFCKRITITGNDWQRIVIRFSEFGMSETFEKEKIGALSVFNMTPNSRGSFVIDNLSFFTEYDEGLKSEYKLHPDPVPSGPIGELKQQYPDNIIYQICNEQEGLKAVGGKVDDPTTPMGSTDLVDGRIPLIAGTKNYLHFTIRNKTDERVDGMLTIEGLPEGTIFEDRGEYIPYTVVWRQQNTVAFAFTLPEDAKGNYTIRVIDAYARE